MAVSDFEVPDVSPRVQYVATAGQTAFPIPFRFFAGVDVKALLDTSLIPVNPAEYTIIGDGLNSNGTLTFDVGLTAGTVVTLYRDSAIERVTNFFNSGEWTAQNVNDQLNRLTMYVQEVALRANELSVMLPVNTTLGSITFPDEGPSANSNRVITWNPTGDELILGPTVSSFAEISDYFDEIETVSDNIINVNTVATNISSVNSCASNMAAIIAAPAQATSAAASAASAAADRIAAEAAAAGLKYKLPAKVATTAALPACIYDNGVSGVGATLTANANGAFPAQDGVTLALNERLIVKNQINTAQPQPLRVAEVQGRVITNWLSAGGSNNRHATYQPMVLPYAMTSLATLMQGWVFKQYANGYHNLPNAFTVEKMWIECPNGNVVLVKWAGGRTKTVNPGDNDVVSDEILPAEAGYGSSFPAGTYIIKSELSITAGASIPFVQNTFNVVSRTYASGSTTLTADTAGPLVFTGTAPSSPGLVGFKPVLLGRATLPRKCFIGIGDSISDGGGGDSAYSDIYGNGFLQRAMGNGGTNPYPCLNFTSHGVRTWLYKQEEDANIGKWVELIKYANHAVVELSTNDIDAYASAILEADMKEVWAILRAEGISTITQVPLLANTNTTDNWATSANQTAASANWGAATSRRSTFNAMLATELGLGTINYLVNTSALLDATDIWKWKTNGSAKFVNDDAVHPNANGHALLATATRTVLDSISVANTATSAAHNGVYTLTQVGSVSLPWRLTRATDADTWNELVSLLISSEQGTAQKDFLFLCTVDSGGVLGTNDIAWVRFNDPNFDLFSFAVDNNPTGSDFVNWGKTSTSQTLRTSIENFFKAINTFTAETILDFVLDKLPFFDTSAGSPRTITPLALRNQLFDVHRARILNGLTISNNVADATNDIDVASGSSMSDDGLTVMTTSSAITKRLDAAWAVGSGNGGLDTGTIGDGTYHVYLIHRPDTRVTDVLLSLSATSPTMPANYTRKTRIGSIVRKSGAILGFKQFKDKFMWTTPQLDQSITNIPSSRSAYTFTVPTGIQVGAIIGGQLTGLNNGSAVHLSDFDQADVTVSINSPYATGGYSVGNGDAVNGSFARAEYATNTSAQIYIKSSDGTTDGSFVCYGYVDYGLGV